MDHTGKKIDPIGTPGGTFSTCKNFWVWDLLGLLGVLWSPQNGPQNVVGCSKKRFWVSGDPIGSILGHIGPYRKKNLTLLGPQVDLFQLVKNFGFGDLLGLLGVLLSPQNGPQNGPFFFHEPWVRDVLEGSQCAESVHGKKFTAGKKSAV